MGAGLTVVEFYDLTPREVRLAVQSRTEARLTTAWLGEALARTKRLPSLDNWLGKGTPRRQVTAVEAKTEFEELRAAMGGTRGR